MKKLILLFLILTITNCSSLYNIQPNQNRFYQRWEYTSNYVPLWWNPYMPQVVIIQRIPVNIPSKVRTNQTPTRSQKIRRSNRITSTRSRGGN